MSGVRSSSAFALHQSLVHKLTHILIYGMGASSEVAVRLYADVLFSFTNALKLEALKLMLKTNKSTRPSVRELQVRAISRGRLLFPF